VRRLQETRGYNNVLDRLWWRLCKANCTDHVWTDGSMSATWRNQPVSHGDFVRYVLMLGIALSPIFDWPGAFKYLRFWSH
jgi:hypothetical protein